MFSTATAIRTLCNLTCAALLLTNGVMGQDRSPEVRFITLDGAKGRAAGAATSNLAQLGIDAMVKSKVAANVQKTFLDVQRSQKIRDLTRRLAASYQVTSLEDTSARATAESEKFQAELDYRSAYTPLKRLVDGS